MDTDLITTQDSTEESNVVDRINYDGPIDSLAQDISRSYDLGDTIAYKIISTGYEDCNLELHTHNGPYLAKVFAKDRSIEDINRVAATMVQVVKSGINHPKLSKIAGSQSQYLLHRNGLSMVVMDYIEGETFLEAQRAPNDDELTLVVEQAAKINNMKYHPRYIEDSWAIPNCQKMFENVKFFLSPRDATLVAKTLEKYKQIPVEELPHCFVHGDFTQANILKGNDGKIYVLDFSVANWYPRVQELAVIAANLMHTTDSSLKQNLEKLVRKYEQFNDLTDLEKKYLYDYALVGSAMWLMGGYFEENIHHNHTEENEHWKELGRKGLINGLLYNE